MIKTSKRRGALNMADRKGRMMTKNNLVRWILDLAVVAGLMYAGWSFKQFSKLNENDIIHRTQLESFTQSIETINKTLESLDDTIREQSEQMARLVVAATFRTDPWSGQMQVVLQDRWFDLMRGVIPDLKYSDIPDVRQIQREYSAELIPEGLK